MKDLNGLCFYKRGGGTVYLDKYWDSVVFLFEEFLKDIAFTSADLFNW